MKRRPFIGSCLPSFLPSFVAIIIVVVVTVVLIKMFNAVVANVIINNSIIVVLVVVLVSCGRYHYISLQGQWILRVCHESHSFQGSLLVKRLREESEKRQSSGAV